MATRLLCLFASSTVFGGASVQAFTATLFYLVHCSLVFWQLLVCPVARSCRTNFFCSHHSNSMRGPFLSTFVPATPSKRHFEFPHVHGSAPNLSGRIRTIAVTIGITVSRNHRQVRRQALSPVARISRPFRSQRHTKSQADEPSAAESPRESIQKT